LKNSLKVTLKTLIGNNSSNKLLTGSNQLLYFEILICAPFDSSVCVEGQKCINVKRNKEKTQINEAQEQCHTHACAHTHTLSLSHTEYVIMRKICFNFLFQ
jgi:hypothetical protein